MVTEIKYTGRHYFGEGGSDNDSLLLIELLVGPHLPLRLNRGEGLEEGEGEGPGREGRGTLHVNRGGIPPKRGHP